MQRSRRPGPDMPVRMGGNAIHVARGSKGRCRKVGGPPACDVPVVGAWRKPVMREPRDPRPWPGCIGTGRSRRHLCCSAPRPYDLPCVANQKIIMIDAPVAPKVGFINPFGTTVCNVNHSSALPEPSAGGWLDTARPGRQGDGGCRASCIEYSKWGGNLGATLAMRSRR